MTEYYKTFRTITNFNLPQLNSRDWHLGSRQLVFKKSCQHYWTHRRRRDQLSEEIPHLADYTKAKYNTGLFIGPTVATGQKSWQTNRLTQTKTKNQKVEN